MMVQMKKNYYKYVVFIFHGFKELLNSSISEYFSPIIDFQINYLNLDNFLWTLLNYIIHYNLIMKYNL